MALGLLAILTGPRPSTERRPLMPALHHCDHLCLACLPSLCHLPHPCSRTKPPTRASEGSGTLALKSGDKKPASPVCLLTL